MSGTLPPGMIPVAALSAAWRLPAPGDRVEALREAGTALRAELLADRPVRGVRTCDLITLPYPTSYAFWHAIRHPSPYLMFTNRMQVVRYHDVEGRARTLLFNPTDYDRAAAVPFYRRLADRYGPFLAQRVLSKRYGRVPEQLAALGVDPAQVDYLSFDHLHTQDLRGWLGEGGAFPRARLLVQRAELALYDRLHPLQSWWYIPEALQGVPAERLVVLEGDVRLGEGVTLVATPGHTAGNHSLVLRTSRGLTVVSENGVALDNYAPHASRLPGLRAYAATGQEVVLNGNTLEHALDQYASMVLEKTLAGPHPEAEGWPNHLSSSELTAHPLFPGLAPTVRAWRPDEGELT